MKIDILDLTDRMKDLIDYYTEDDILIDLDAWSTDDLRAMIAMLTGVLKERGEDSTMDEYFEETMEEWIDRQIGEDVIEALWDEYVAEMGDAK